MVKGVNKQIIEINDTGNSYFERVLLFVSPDKKDKSAELLKLEAKNYLLNLSPEFKGKSLREKNESKKKLIKNIFLSVLVCLVLLSAVTVFILNTL